ncbi:GNAT family N-acetyltransferase [Planctomycetota bacterium]
MKYEPLKDGTTVLLRELDKEDVERSLRFFSALPQEDRRYLRVDVTNREVVERRLQQAVTGEVHRVVAVLEDEIVADGALEIAGDRWHGHMGEIRVIVARKYQRLRLGALLMQELFRVAEHRQVEKVVVKLLGPQMAARKICDRLGFHVDATLADYAKDSEGKLQDLVIMSCTLDEWWSEMKDFYRESNWPDG